ncbi:ferruginol synthase [Phtheirospermum japonicum]|uniref:Ferruginol synthase n=1 Tax=Phtheirospermum japonicum TaxID=374723 RepID=A0A830BRQ0_9LAMI|nr:ferruginol synthase [Phtheirospermum japonicum]
MSLKLGGITAVVISSPETAETVFAKNDLLFSSRKALMAIEIVGHSELSMAWIPVGGQWRKLRKICKEHMLSMARLDASRGLRKEKLDKLCEFMRACSESSRAMDIGDVVEPDLCDALLVGLGDVRFGLVAGDEGRGLSPDEVRGEPESHGLFSGFEAV